MKLLKKIAINLGLVIFGTIIAFVLLEVGTRLYYFKSLFYLPEVNFREFDENLGWRLIPNKVGSIQKIDYIVREKINSKGLRDVEHDYKKEDGVFRIAVLGDSFMEAYQVKLQESFPRLLEEKLNSKTENKFEVINMGVGGYGTAQEYLYFVQEGVKYEPDLVILAFLPNNDVRNNSEILEQWIQGTERTYKVTARPFFYLADDGELKLRMPDKKAAQKSIEELRVWFKEQLKEKFLDKILLYKIIINRIKSQDKILTSTCNIERLYGLYLMDYSPKREEGEEALEVTKRIILKLRDKVNETGAEFMMFSVTTILELNERFRENIYAKCPEAEEKMDIEKPQQILNEFVQENNINYLPLLPYFKKYKKDTGKYLHHFRDDAHWNTEGHILAAETVYNYLVENGLVPIKK